MEQLYSLIVRHEAWLVDQVIDYGKRHNYVKYSSTLKEAWRKSIVDLSAKMQEVFRDKNRLPEINLDTDFIHSLAGSYGIQQARNHRERGVGLGMFLGLLKYYRQSYIDLIYEKGGEQVQIREYILLIDRFFNYLEIGLCEEWAGTTKDSLVEELQFYNQALTNEKNKYLTIYESLPNPVILLDQNNNIDIMNHAASQLFLDQHTPGMSYYGTVQSHLESPLGFVRDLIAGIAGVNGARQEIDLIKRIDTRRGPLYFEIKVKQMLDFSSKFQGTVIIFNDITELKKAEETTRQINAELNQIFDTAAGALRVIDRNFNVLRINDTFAQMAGWSAEELVGKKCYDTFGGYFCNTPRCPVTRILNGEKRVEYDEEIESPGGTKTSYNFVAVPFLAPNGEILGIVEDFRDISERKEAQALQAKFQLLCEHAQDIILFLGPDGRILETNDTAVEAYGYTREELSAKNIRDLRAGDDNSLIPTQLKQASTTGILFETRHRRKDGSTFPVEVSSTIREIDGEKVLLSIARDITERKKIEEQLRYISCHDALTGLYNRNHFEQEICRLESENYDPVGIIICDVDELKQVNDRWGHAAGDKLLKTAANVIKNAFRREDIIARIGGDEFVVLLPNSSVAAVERSYHRIKNAISKYNTTKPELPLSVSVGYAVKKGRGVGLGDALKIADNNMYKEKISYLEHTGSGRKKKITYLGNTCRDTKP